MDCGFKRAVSEGVVGFVMALVIRNLALSFGPYWVIFLFNILSIVSTVSLIDKMPFWSFSYLAGWLIGLIYIGPVFLSLPELILYLSITLLVLYQKFAK